MSETQKSVLGGMTVLSIVGLLCKIVGALYRIPLAWLIGDEGLGLYQLVFPTYNMLLTISSAGLPVAISRMVSFALAKDDPRSAKRIFRISLCMLFAVGCVATILMIVFSPALAARTGDQSSMPGFLAIAPSLLLVCTMSALRGFMQGQQNMVPTAISQLIEQVGKVFISLPLAYYGMRISTAYAAAGVLLGTSIAEGAALIYMFRVYKKKRAGFDTLKQAEDAEQPTWTTLLKRILSLSIPITLGNCIIPIASFIDSGLILKRLYVSGVAPNQALGLYGRYSAYVLTLINVPTALATAIAMSMVPSISGAVARRDDESVQRKTFLGLRLSFVVGLPCSVGMSVLSTQLLSLIYPFQTKEALMTTAGLLSLSSITIVLFTIVQATSGVLQGLQKQRIPMYTLVLGVVVKIILNYTLIGTPSIHIFGAPIASIACYTLSMIPNLFFVHKYTGLKFKPWDIAGRAAAASAVMLAILLVAVRSLPSGRLWTMILVCLGVVVYVVFAKWFGAITDEDIAPLTRRFARLRKRGL